MIVTIQILTFVAVAGAGGLAWGRLVDVVPYRHLYWAYFGGAAVPIGAALCWLVVWAQLGYR